MLRWLIAITGMAVTGMAAAQELTPAPTSLPGTIRNTDPSDSQGRRYDEVLLELVRGQRISITVAPTAGSRLQTGIQLFLNGSATPLAAAIAPSGPPARRLAFTAPRDGIFNLRVLATGPAMGGYTLSIGPATASAPSRGFSGGVIGGAIGSVAPQPSPPDGAATEPVGGSLPAVGGGARSRFIICPGHPRCPRR